MKVRCQGEDGTWVTVYSTVQYTGVTVYGSVQYSAKWHWGHIVKYSTVHWGLSVQCSAVQCSTVHWGHIVQYSSMYSKDGTGVTGWDNTSSTLLGWQITVYTNIV